MTGSSKAKEFLAPVVVLTAICLVVSAALAFTYKVANPIIVENTAAAARTARAELLPEADDFTDLTASTELVETDGGKVSVTETYAADNGAGYVFTVVTASFGGKLTMMVGVDADGAVTGIKVTDHSDTPGVGTKDQDPDYLAQYTGLAALNSPDSVKKENSVTSSGEPFAYISGASVSGTAIHKGVAAALAQFAKMGGES